MKHVLDHSDQQFLASHMLSCKKLILEGNSQCETEQELVNSWYYENGSDLSLEQKQVFHHLQEITKRIRNPYLDDKQSSKQAMKMLSRISEGEAIVALQETEFGYQPIVTDQFPSVE